MPIRGVRDMGRIGCQPDESQKAFDQGTNGGKRDC
jgi:hypothetical protein